MHLLYGLIGERDVEIMGDQAVFWVCRRAVFFISWRLLRRYWFRSVLAFFRREVLDCGFGFVGPFAALSSVSPFFLKKLTLKTLSRDYKNEAPLPGLA